MKYNEIIADFTDKSYKATREIDKLADEQAKLLKQLEELREKLSVTQAEKNALQKSLTKEVCLLFFLQLIEYILNIFKF